MNERSILRPFVLFVCEMWEICSSIKSNLLLGYTILSYIIIVRMHYIPTCTVYSHDNETIIISLKAKMYCIPSNNRDESFRLGEMCVVGRRREFPSDLQQQKGVPTQIPLYPPSCQSQNISCQGSQNISTWLFPYYSSTLPMMSNFLILPHTQPNMANIAQVCSK